MSSSQIHNAVEVVTVDGIRIFIQFATEEIAIIGAAKLIASVGTSDVVTVHTGLGALYTVLMDEAVAVITYV